MFGHLKSFRQGDAGNLSSVLTESRAKYMEAYRTALISYRRQFHPSGPEAMFDLLKSEFPPPFRYFRVDLASGAVSPPNITKVSIAPATASKSETFHCHGLALNLHPIVWSGIDFVTSPFPPAEPRFVEWCSSWLDLAEKHKPDRDGFFGVIHSVTFPTYKHGAWTFSVDFGTAPIAAFHELLIVLDRLGSRSVTAGSVSQGKTETKWNIELMEALTCHSSKTFARQSISLFVALLLLFQFGFWKDFGKPVSVQRSHNILFGGLVSLFCAGFIALGIRQLFKRKPYLIIDSEGLCLPGTGMPIIPWREVRAIRRTSDLFGHSYLDVFLESVGPYMQALKGPQRRRAKFGRRIGDGHFSFIITSLDVPAEKIYSTIQHCLSNAKGSNDSPPPG